MGLGTRTASLRAACDFPCLESAVACLRPTKPREALATGHAQGHSRQPHPFGVRRHSRGSYSRWKSPSLCQVEIGPLFCGLAAAKWREAQPQPQGDQSRGQRAYHPSTALRRTCPRTGAEAWRCCHSGDPCFSSATRRLCNPPARARIPNHRLRWGHKRSQPLGGQADPTGGEVKNTNTPRPRFPSLRRK